MFKSSILFAYALYVLPLFLLAFGYNNESLIFVAGLGLVTAFVHMMIYGTSNRDRKPIQATDHSQEFVAPIGLVLACIVLYVSLKMSVILSAFQALSSGYLAQIMLSSAVDRYSGSQTAASIPDLIGIIFLFLFFTFWGTRTLQKQSRTLNVFLISFAVFAFFVESLALARAGFLLALLCYFVEVLIRRNNALENYSLWTYLKIALPLGGLAFTVYMFSAYFRVYGSEDAIYIALNKLANYTIVSHDLFLVWFDLHYRTDLDLGRNTFTFFWKLTGFTADQGYYQPMVGQFGSGNIYLNLRGLVQDFGAAAAIFFWMANLAFIGYCARSRLTASKYFFVRISIAFLFFPIYSPFLFTNFSLAFLFSGLVLIALRMSKSTKRRYLKDLDFPR